MLPGQLRRWLQILAGIIVCVLLATGGLAVYSVYYYFTPGPLTEGKTVIFKRGEGFRAIVDDLSAQGVITNPELFELQAVVSGKARTFKAGEYDFSAAITPRLVMDMIAAGHVVIHKFTVPEGLTVLEVEQLLTNEPALSGDIPPNVEEGSLLPETYHFTYGDARQEVILRMQAAMTQLIAGLWEKRKSDLPFKTPAEAMVLASIVEKETGVDGERGRVAAVFINRLRKGMKLQSDPTVTYGLDKSGALGRELTFNDLKKPTPYNTYVIGGLPPTPISNPGRAAIIAVLNPPDTNDLYFVATGKGGHNFASSLKEHNENVKAYHDTIAKKP